MNLKESLNRQRKGHAEETELNLTAVMNVFLILIPFMLLTAVFVKISVLELALPNLDKKSAVVKEKPAEAIVINFLYLRKDDFELKSPDLKFSKITKEKNEYNWAILNEQLAKVKTKYPDSEDIIISPDDEIKYNTIINVMDKCRESGFPNISISG